MTTIEELEERIKALEMKNAKLVGFRDATIIRNKLYHLGNQAEFANLLYINPAYNNRIGIGETSPQKPLHITQTAVTPRIRLEHTDSHYVDIGYTEGAADESIAFIEPYAPDGDEPVIIRMFRETNTTGSVEAQLLQGTNQSLAAIVLACNAASGTTIFNEQGVDIDFRIESDNEDKIFYVDAGADIVRIGDYDTNYVQFAVDGEMTLVGTARVKRHRALPINCLASGNTPPDEVIIGDYLGYSYDIGDDSVFVFELPKDWNSGTNLLVYIYWYINENYATGNGEVRWGFDWSATPPDMSEAIDSPSNSGSVDYGDANIPTNAKTIKKTVAGNINGASLAADDVIGMTIHRDALLDGSNPTADPVILRVDLVYTANKLGEAT